MQERKYFKPDETRLEYFKSKNKPVDKCMFYGSCLIKRFIYIIATTVEVFAPV